MKSGRLVVKTHSPLRTRLTLLGLAIAIIGTAAVLYYLGELNAGFDQVAAADERKRLQGTIAAVEKEKANLRDKVALLERSNQVDKEAYSEVDSNLKALQEEILELREEVTFYRGIVSPVESSAGLRIERFRVDKQGEDSLFHYNLVLTQVLKNDRTVAGDVDITIEGLQEGQPKTMALEKISTQRSNLKFRFRYFQKFEGDIRLPEGFSPRSVVVEVSPYRKKNITRSFMWPEQGGEAVATTAESS